MNCFTLRIIIVLMETIKDLDISTDSDCPPPYDDYDADAEPQDSSTDLTWSRSRDLLTARKRSRSERRSRHATRTVRTLRAERLDQSGHSGEPSSSGLPQPLPSNTASLKM